MSLINPLAERLERFVYERVCALASLAPQDMGHATGHDALATPCNGPMSDADRQ